MHEVLHSKMALSFLSTKGAQSPAQREALGNELPHGDFFSTNGAASLYFLIQTLKNDCAHYGAFRFGMDCISLQRAAPCANDPALSELKQFQFIDWFFLVQLLFIGIFILSSPFIKSPQIRCMVPVLPGS
jgi:hypothetical protein